MTTKPRGFIIARVRARQDDLWMRKWLAMSYAEQQDARNKHMRSMLDLLQPAPETPLGPCIKPTPERTAVQRFFNIVRQRG